MVLYLKLFLLHFIFVLCGEKNASLVLPPRSPCNKCNQSKLNKAQNHSCSPPNDFSYGEGPTGPDNWPAMFRTCDGDKQSPINIDMSNLRRQRAGALDWSPAYFNTPKKMTLTNVGHRLVLRANYPDDCQPRLRAGILQKVYTFKAIDFHWGSTNSKGSEHTVDEYAYPMEMHVIHTSGVEFSNLQTVVIAYFFQIGEKRCTSIDKILEVFTKAVRHPNRPIKLRHPFSLSSLLYAFASEYITYEGSFTVPPCQEGVKWIIYPYPLEISLKQLEKFRLVCKYARDLVNNYRPIQPLNNRCIHFVS
ncbi:hypothetical protein ILUMI_25729 [Ignelater luminosus]|uniref:Carbonic anhydrase n=1 Tax=Ignelater luminosus TaxID=2038154 RepID=A0A8K0C7X3_IGNLU|nr:hypothetical protein ILUMI_25729 [Ignelater luminosus]